MLLCEILAKDFDLSNYDKKLMVNIIQAGEDGLNISDLYKYEDSPHNLRMAKTELERIDFIEETDKRNFFIITDIGFEALNRASIVDDNNELISANSDEYLYTDNEDNGL